MRKTAFLSRHRISIPGARYFVTCTTKGRRAGLTGEPVGTQLINTLVKFDASGDSSLVCATIMPDHFHWVFTLGARLTVSQVVARWKVRTRPILAGVTLEWQVNLYEHRLRHDENVEAYAFYVFMNPYVAGAVTMNDRWPWWRTGDGVQFDFATKLCNDGIPQLLWLDTPAARGEGLGIGKHD